MVAFFGLLWTGRCLNRTPTGLPPALGCGIIGYVSGVCLFDDPQPETAECPRVETVGYTERGRFALTYNAPDSWITIHGSGIR